MQVGLLGPLLVVYNKFDIANCKRNKRVMCSVFGVETVM